MVNSDSLYWLPKWHDHWYGDYDEKKYRDYQFFHAFPIFREWIDNDIATSKTAYYLDRYGLDYSDIKDPSKLYDAENGSRALRSFEFVSHNVTRLFR